MLSTCQSRVAFSKSKWYASAIHKIFKPIVLAHLRQSSSAAAAAADCLDLVPDHNNSDINDCNKKRHSLLLPLQNDNDNKNNDEMLPMDNYRRCEGYRIYDGGRCRRLVRIDPHTASGPTFCFNHHPNPQYKNKQNSKNNKRNSPELKRIPPTILPLVALDSKSSIKESNLFKPPSKLFDCWNLWLGNHMSKEVKQSMFKEMIKPINRLEKPGYIYVYSLQKGPRVSGKGHAYFKIGRTINPHRRMYQVNNICDHEPKIIELFPSFPLASPAVTKPTTSNATMTTEPSIINQHIMATNLETLDDIQNLDDLPKCPLPHRVEKLIHWELFSLYKKAAFKCAKCGTEHREWIKVDRGMHPDEHRPLTDHELWLSRIRPVILRWIQYGVLASAIAEANIMQTTKIESSPSSSTSSPSSPSSPPSSSSTSTSA